MGQDPRVQVVVYVLGVWGGAILPALFLIYYTWIAKWWDNPTGRTIVALDVVILLLRVDRLYGAWQYHTAIDPRVSDWFAALVMAAVPVIIGYRMFAFERKRRLLKRQARVSATTLALVASQLRP
jgi:hypothetical protein